MPSVVIEVRKNHGQALESEIIKVVYQAMESAFNISPSDSTIRLIVHEPHRYQPDPDLDQGELHTHISIDTFVGRSIEMKRELYQNIVTNLDVLGIPKNHVEILLREVQYENWGIRGGQAACDLI